MNKSSLWLGMAAAVVLLSGCVNEPDEYEVKDYTSISNPASVYCVQQGGELNTVTENDQRVTYCVFSDDDRTEQWEYYRESQQKNNEMATEQPATAE